MLDTVPPAFEAPAPAPQLPGDYRAMVDAAVAEGDGKAVEKLLGWIERARPDLSPAVVAIRTHYRAQQVERAAAIAELEKRKLAEAGPFDNWNGQVEFGASWTTGPVESLGAIGALDLSRTGLAWTHKLLLRGEVQDTDGVRAVERILASWQPRRSLGTGSYVFGLGQYERDPALGYDARYSAALGAGWSLTAGKSLKVSIEGGPAVRRTEQDGASATRIAGRGTLDLGLVLGPRLDFGQRVSLFYESGTSSGVLSSTLDSKLSEKLKLRFTYEYRVEEDGLTGTSSSGSASRASLVYRL